MSSTNLYGLYRGTVVTTLDPLGLGRLQVNVPSAMGASDLSWARPCMPYSGWFMLPPTGTLVWVMFEEGNPADPVWMGIFWDDLNRPPASPPLEMTKVLKTDGITLTIQDAPGAASLTLETAMGAKLVLGPSGIEIDNGMGAKITLQGPQVSVNSGALEII